MYWYILGAFREEVKVFSSINKVFLLYVLFLFFCARFLISFTRFNITSYSTMDSPIHTIIEMPLT